MGRSFRVGDVVARRGGPLGVLWQDPLISPSGDGRSPARSGLLRDECLESPAGNCQHVPLGPQLVCFKGSNDLALGRLENFLGVWAEVHFSQTGPELEHRIQCGSYKGCQLEVASHRVAPNDRQRQLVDSLLVSCFQHVAVSMEDDLLGELRLLPEVRK